MILHHHSVAKFRIDNPRPLLDLASFTNDGFALDVNIGMNDRIATDLRLAADVRVRWIDKGHAFFHHQTPNRATSNQVFEFSQLSPRVDSCHLSGIVIKIEIYSPTTALEERGRIC